MDGRIYDMCIITSTSVLFQQLSTFNCKSDSIDIEFIYLNWNTKIFMSYVDLIIDLPLCIKYIFRLMYIK